MDNTGIGFVYPSIGDFNFDELRYHEFNISENKDCTSYDLVISD